MTQQEQYWKERCEAAEKYISTLKDADYKKWINIRHAEPPAPACHPQTHNFHIARHGKCQDCGGTEWMDAPAQAQGVEEEEFTSVMLFEKGQLSVESFDEDSEMEIHIGDSSHLLDVADVKELIHFLQSHLYHETGEIYSSRWQQGQANEEAFKNDPVNFLLSNAMRYLTEPQKIALRDALIERTPKATPTIGARWVRGTPPNDDLYPIKYGSKLQFLNTGFFDGQRWFINGGSTVLEKNTPVEYLSESPATFPTREQAEKWADESYPTR